jgi:hydrogenase nickel incorporation protein HypA/HybF
MHELSIAEAIVGVARRHAAGRRVVRVEVRVGHLRQVVPDSLQLAFGLLVEGTAMDGAELVIEHVPAVGRCRDCGTDSVLEAFPLQCASCGGLDLDLLTGGELLVDALDLEDESVTNERIGHGSHV